MVVMSDPRTGSVLAVGASAGGVEALSRLVSDLPADLDAPVFVVLHVSATGISALPSILTRSGPLPAAHATDGERIEAGRIYVAPPDRHLLIEDGVVRVIRGPRENLARPAIDPLFRSAAVANGPRAIAVVLSGARADGTAGADAVSRRGGTVLVQDPGDAEFGEMPRSAIAQDHPDQVLPLERIAPAITEHVRALSEEEEISDDTGDEMSLEARYSALEMDAVERDKAPGDLTPFSCPECGGALWEINQGEFPRFRCRVGHAYETDAVLDDQSNAVDRALWIAFRALLERASMSQRIARRMRKGNGSSATVARFDRMAEEAHAQAAVIRDVLLKRDASAA